MNIKSDIIDLKKSCILFVKLIDSNFSLKFDVNCMEAYNFPASIEIFYNNIHIDSYIKYDSKLYYSAIKDILDFMGLMHNSCWIERYFMYNCHNCFRIDDRTWLKIKEKVKNSNIRQIIRILQEVQSYEEFILNLNMCGITVND